MVRVMLICVVLMFAWGSRRAEAAGEKRMALTVYNEDLALVKDVRLLDLKKGMNRLSFVDVAAKIDPTSVHFTSLTAPDRVAILEQNYEYDLVSSDKLLQKYVDQKVRVLAKEGKVYEGKLLSASGGDLVLEDTDGGVRVVDAKAVEGLAFPALPEGLITRPTLVWLVECEKAGTHEVEVSYLTGGMGWHTEYVAVADKEDQQLDLSGWVSIENRSGATYEDARLKLVAGEVHRVREYPPVRPMPGARVMAMKAVPQFEERGFFEYHLYSLPRPATVKDNQIKQLSLFPNARVAVKKVYSYDASVDEKKVQVKLEFTNSKKAGLGMALPKGKVRVYKEDVDGSLEFIGEDRIDHTPKDEKVRLVLGDAFDVVGERKVSEHRRISDRVTEERIEITLRNHKDEDITVLVTEHPWGDWEVLESSQAYRKKDVRTLEFDVPVKKDGEGKVIYRIRYVR